MIVGLLALYFFVFGGGNQTFLLNPDLKKNVDTYVVDKNRRSDIAGIIKQVKKDEENFQKQTKKVYGKTLVDLNMNRASTREDFKLEYDSFYTSLEALQNSYLDSELKIRSLIHPNEWDSIMNKVLKQPDNKKVRKALFGQNEKFHNRLLSACEKSIPDSVGKMKARNLADGYRAKGDTLVNAFLNLNYRYIHTIRPYKVTRKDFEPQRREMIKLRRDYSNFLVDMRFQLMAITPEKKWETIAKELNTDFNYLGAGASR